MSPEAEAPVPEDATQANGVSHRHQVIGVVAELSEVAK